MERATGGAWLRLQPLFSETAKQPQNCVSADAAALYDGEAATVEASAAVAPPAAAAAVPLPPLPPLGEPGVQQLAGLLARLAVAPRSREELQASLRLAATRPAAAAAPAIERAIRADRSVPLVWAARALGALAQRVRPALARALGEAA